MICRRSLLLVLTVLTAAVFFGSRQSESPLASATSCLSVRAQLDLAPPIPGKQEPIPEARFLQARPQSPGIAQSLAPTTPSTASNLSDMPLAEQKSLWAAFSEARREVRLIPVSRAQRPENLGFDFYALHPKQDLTTRFGSNGVQIVSSERTYTKSDAEQPSTRWQVEMRLHTFAGKPIQMGALARTSDSASSRIEYRHTPAITEWYDNGITAIEHGYTLTQRPAHLTAGEDVVIEVALSGLNAAAHTADDGTYQLNFNEGDRTVLSYSKLLVVDAQGKELPATMKPTAAGFALAYNDAQAAYPVTVDPLIVNEEAKVNLSDAAAEDSFGYSVAISGDSVVVGSYQDDDDGSNSGSAYVFIRTGTYWSLQAKLTAGDAATDDLFGRSVSISGDSVVVGSNGDDDGGSASGSAYVFIRVGASWSQQAKLTAGDAAAADSFGSSVAISGDSVVVGANGDDDGGSASGSAYLFTRSGSSWSQQAKLTAGDAAAGDLFGRSVAISGDSVVVGALFDDDGGSASGSAYVFIRTGTSWSQQAKLTAGDAALSDNFGISVAISGDSVVVGAFQDDDAGSDSGSAYVFTRTGTSWSQQAKLTASDAAGNDLFGASVSISGDSVVVGARGSEVVYFFTRSGTSWSQQGRFIVDGFGPTGNSFGFSVAISGNSVVVGAHQDDASGSNSGSAYVFTRTGASWFRQATLTAGDAAASDIFGASVAISGDSIVIGIQRDDDGGSESGSAYVFTRTGTSWSPQAKLTASDAASDDFFGISIAISGDSVVVGASGDDDGGSGSGSAYVFTRTGTSWSQQAKLIASDAAEFALFGTSVAISGDSIVVGSRGDDDGGSFSGSAYVFSRSGTLWSQQAKLTAGDAATEDEFGSSVSISGDSVVVGAWNDDDGGLDSGSAYVFARTGTSWFQQAKLTAGDPAANDRFGYSVAISGDSIVVGSDGDDDGGSASGSAYVFTRSGSSWSQQAKLTASDAAAGDLFGFSVAISGDSVVAGAYTNDDDGSNSGSAYVFTRTGTSWSQQAKLTAGDAAAGDWFGYSVAISGDSVVVGAYQDDDSAQGSGSAYIFRFAVSGQRQLLVYDRFGTELINSSTATPFVGQLLGTSHAYTFRLTNAGALALDLQSISLGGNLTEFSLTVPNISSTADLASGQSLDLTITFSPSGGSSALRNASVNITSNDSDTPVISFNISGLGLSNATDGDGDGMNDWAEYSLRGFGFDWETAQPNRVNDYYDLASTAGLYNQAEVAAVAGSAVLSDVDTTTNTAILTIELQESLDLESFTPLIANPGKLSVDGSGKIRYEVTAPPGKKFYRAGFQE